VDVLPKRYKIIACEILYREVCYCVAKSKNIIDITFLDKGLHDLGSKKMLSELQDEIDRTDITKYEAILLGYGLCNNGIIGLKSKLPLIVPRAHDCITLLLGSKEKYKQYHSENAGTFFKSVGWIERDTDPNDNEGSITSQLGMNKTYQQYVDKYGEETAKYLMDTLGNWLENYTKYSYIDTTTGNFNHYKKLTKSQADKKDWDYEELDGTTDLFMNLLDGYWDEEEFLIVPPNKTIKPSYDDQIIKTV
jgi:hypothetical protein